MNLFENAASGMEMLKTLIIFKGILECVCVWLKELEQKEKEEKQQ